MVRIMLCDHSRLEGWMLTYRETGRVCLYWSVQAGRLAGWQASHRHEMNMRFLHIGRFGFLLSSRLVAIRAGTQACTHMQCMHAMRVGLWLPRVAQPKRFEICVAGSEKRERYLNDCVWH